MIPWLRACSTAASSRRSRACEVATADRTIWYMYHMVRREETEVVSQLSVEAKGTTQSRSPDRVVPRVRCEHLPAMGPVERRGLPSPSAGPSRKGSVQWFRYGRRTTSVEEILEVEEPSRVAYKVVGGLPVENYRAEVTLTATPSGGTSIRWTATWDNTFLGKVVRHKLQRIYPEIVDALVAAADHHELRAHVHDVVASQEPGGRGEVPSARRARCS